MPIPTDEARATALDPHRVNLHPALIHDAWATLKAARGQPVARPELLRPAHLIAAPAPAGMAAVEAARCRVAATVRRLIAEGRVTPTGGTAA